MTGAERGWLLLCADLADGVKPLSPAQVRSLRRLVNQADKALDDPEASLTVTDLIDLGCEKNSAERILRLLDREEALDVYLRAAEDRGIRPLTRSSPDYPARLLRLGDSAPGVLFYRGELSVLKERAISLTGSRDLSPEGAAFCRRVGKLAAMEGLVLVSGNARGADRAAQSACLEAGGSVISVIPGPLFETEPESERQLMLCENGWQLPFSEFRALSRNRLIYALSDLALVAEVGLRGGTMRGASEAIRNGILPVFVRENAGPGSRELIQLGADPVSEDLTSLRDLRPSRLTLWDFEQEHG